MSKRLLKLLSPKVISVGARQSPLSKVQVEEVLKELQKKQPDVTFQPHYVLSTGDKDQKTSLRSLNKTDFFTKEVDAMVLKRQCRVGIHSAKDLPDPLPQGLYLAALTRGLDSSDSLVTRTGMTWDKLPRGALIATSSVRREEAIRNMRSDFTFTDIRGIIGQRLAKLESGEVDGVVIAEAALIRLNLTHLTRIKIPGDTVAHQGQLAVIAREEDLEMRNLFSSIDCREKKPKLLYLGLTPPHQNVIHYPIIRIEPKPFEGSEIRKAFHFVPLCTHLIFTSQTAATIFFEYLKLLGVVLGKKTVIAVGRATAYCLESLNCPVDLCAQQESAEGIINELEALDLTKATFFWPHSALSRPLISDYLLQRKIGLYECILYDTVANLTLPKIDLTEMDEIFFSSPSCLDAFLQIFGSLPTGKRLIAIGPITKMYLDRLIQIKN